MTEFRSGATSSLPWLAIIALAVVGGVLVRAASDGAWSADLRGGAATPAAARLAGIRVGRQC